MSSQNWIAQTQAKNWQMIMKSQHLCEISITCGARVKPALCCLVIFNMKILYYAVKLRIFTL